MSQILFICFARVIKGFYQSSLGNEVDFWDTMNVSPNILAKNSYFKKLRHGFVGERAMITTPLISSCHCIFNTNSELSQNRTEKQIVPSKTNWPFNDICYLVIACFD